MQVSGQLPYRAVSGRGDRCRVVRPHLGPMILVCGERLLPGKLPAELPAKVEATGRRSRRLRTFSATIMSRTATSSVPMLVGDWRSGSRGS
jgi:hypothetical protein